MKNHTLDLGTQSDGRTRGRGSVTNVSVERMATLQAMEGNGFEDEGDVVGGQGKHKVTGVGLAPDTGKSQRSHSQGR